MRMTTTGFRRLENSRIILVTEVRTKKEVLVRYLTVVLSKGFLCSPRTGKEEFSEVTSG